MPAETPPSDVSTTRASHRTSRATDELIRQRTRAVWELFGRRPRTDEILAVALLVAEQHPVEFADIYARRNERSAR